MMQGTRTAPRENATAPAPPAFRPASPPAPQRQRQGPGRAVRRLAASLRDRPALTLTVLLSLVLGIGINTAIFSIMDALFLRPLPLPDLDRLVAAHQVVRGAESAAEFSRFSYPNYLDLAERQRFLTHLAASQRLPMNLSGVGESQRVNGRLATVNYFDVLGVRPVAGRFFGAAEERRGGGAAAVVLSHGAWSRLFAADPAILGESVRINGQPMTVIGIAPRGFQGVEVAVAIDVWVPMAAYERISPYAEMFPLDVRDVQVFDLIGRLEPGVSLDTAQADLRRIAADLEAEHPQANEQQTVRLIPLLEGAILPRERGRYLAYARALALAVGLVLLIACLNSAHLLAVSGLDRARELATRAAVGATRARLAGQLLADTVVLFAAGGLLSIPFAAWSVDFLWSLRPPELAVSGVAPRIDGRILVFLFALTLLAGLASGLLPALRASRPDLASLLRDAVEPPRSIRLWSPRNLLSISQIGLAATALITGGLFLKSLASADRIDLGFEPEPLLVMTVTPGMEGYGPERTRLYYQALLERVAALPQIEAAALSENRLLRGGVMRRQVYPEGRDRPAALNPPQASNRTNVVTPGFFDTVGLEIVRGRDFDTTDRAGGRLVAIINQTMAETVWTGRDALGKGFHFDAPDQPRIEVVGVVEDAKYRYIHEDPQFFLYLPLAQNDVPTMTLHARVRGDPAAALEPTHRVVQALDRSVPVSDVRTMRGFVDDALWLERTVAALWGLFAVLALVLALVGLYGVMHYATEKRRREIGIRMAVGAGRRTILAMILGEGMVMVGAGIAVGMLLAFFVATPLVRGHLFGIQGAEPILYLTVALLLLAAALLGSYFPARRASHLDPQLMLRYE